MPKPYARSVKALLRGAHWLDMGGIWTRTFGPAARVGIVVAALCVAAGPLVVACSPRSDAQADGSSGGPLSGTLHVMVAASLLPLADELAGGFEQAHPGVDVLIFGGGSSTLREQILAGAPADVFVPADSAHLERVRSDIGLAGAPTNVARNSLVLAVPANNPAAVTDLADLARPELLVGMCAAEVPCGALARAGLTAAGIEASTDTEEPNVRALVTKLAAGELDAGVVYASDVLIESASISSLGWSAGAAPEAVYPAAVVATAPNPRAATAFVEFLASEAALDIFRSHGFESPQVGAR
ncbi:molybdate ABC transporter substrate-binding protein [Candidatus Poriferisodalis sp.]|uniref:molybdate ABC transporter substrate-binding protein n=1 Tax=Candidatus Poriferisodalis sp. TaxID=3101277 RepID=UPI003D14918E